MTEGTQQVRMREWDFNGTKVIAQDISSSHTLDFVAQDIIDNAYGMHNISDPKIILDIGAHVGMVSIYLAKKFPDAHIYAVEPFPMNTLNLRHNIQANGVTNITVMPVALSKDGRALDLGCYHTNTGGVTENVGLDFKPYIESITLDRLIDSLISRHSSDSLISFIKMDIEGFEYEILPGFKQWDKIKDAGIEVHNRLFNTPGYLEEIQTFMDWIHKQPIKGRMWTPPIEAFVEHA